MALTPARRRLNILFGLMLGVFLLCIFAPFLFAPVELWWFCRSIPMGISEEQIQAAATDAGFRMSPIQGDVAHIYDFASLGRFSCVLRVNNHTITDTVFEFRPD